MGSQGSTRRAWMRVAMVIPILAACSPSTAEAILSSSPAATTVTVTRTLIPETRPSLTITEFITVTETVAGTISPTSSLDPTGTTYDGAQLAQGITTILTQVPPAGYGLSGVSDVVCPAEVPVKAGTEFQCSLLVEGAPKAVTIQVQSDDGLYQVHPPA
jgi:hypothetical protein